MSREFRPGELVEVTIVGGVRINARVVRALPSPENELLLTNDAGAYFCAPAAHVVRTLEPPAGDAESSAGERGR